MIPGDTVGIIWDARKSKVLVFVVAYNAEKTIAEVVSRIPITLLDTCELDVLIIDDSSRDATFERGYDVSRDSAIPFNVTVLYNPVNQGYGGNQKIGYRYAIENGYDFVALIHGDGQYAPECLPQLLQPLFNGEADAVFGSRMLNPKNALKGGMPYYKFVGNRILTWMENKLLKSNLSEFHSGYRLYSTRALRAIPFELNSKVFHFDTEIIIQLLVAGMRIKELPIPTYYGDEVCYVNGMKYASDVMIAAAKARLQHVGLLYERKFDCAPQEPSSYQPKLAYISPHSIALQRIKPHSRVLDVGRMGAFLAREKHCKVDGIDGPELPPLRAREYDYVLMLDVLEHFPNPEAFMEGLRRAFIENPTVEIILSTANIGFVITRFMLLIGQFNYSKRGILDLTHTRLFTFRSFERIVEQSGFDIVERVGIPGPFPKALGDGMLGRMLLALNRLLIHLSRGLFSYQILLRAKPQPSLELLLKTAKEFSQKRVEEIETSRS